MAPVLLVNEDERSATGNGAMRVRISIDDSDEDRDPKAPPFELDSDEAARVAANDHEVELRADFKTIFNII